MFSSRAVLRAGDSFTHIFQPVLAGASAGASQVRKCSVRLYASPTDSARFVDEKTVKSLARFEIEFPAEVVNPRVSLNVRLDSNCYAITAQEQSTGKKYVSHLEFDNKGRDSKI